MCFLQCFLEFHFSLHFDDVGSWNYPFLKVWEFKQRHEKDMARAVKKFPVKFLLFCVKSLLSELHRINAWYVCT